MVREQMKAAAVGSNSAVCSKKCPGNQGFLLLNEILNYRFSSFCFFGIASCVNSDPSMDLNRIGQII